MNKYIGVGFNGNNYLWRQYFNTSTNFYSLTDQDQQRVHELIEGTGCEELLLKK